VLPTTAVPVIDPLAQTPLPGALRPAAREPATNFVHVHPAVPARPPVPELDFRLSGSAWDEAAAPATPRPQVGDTVLGFKLVRELGRGAFARVYLAEEVLLGHRPVVVKVSLKRNREAERLARLRHANIVPVHSVSAVGDTQVICMPFLGETTLADLIRRHRAAYPSGLSARRTTAAHHARSTRANSGSKMAHESGEPPSGPLAVHPPTDNPTAAPPVVGDPRPALVVLRQLAAGLEYAHARGTLHLDVKPSNVLLTDAGEALLFDFNLSLEADRGERDHVGGTMPYMSIEQLQDMRARGAGALRVDARTDLYSLGATAFELLTGALPFPQVSSSTAPEFLAAREQGPAPLYDLNPAVSPAVDAIVRKLLAPHPAERYQRAADLIEDIDRHLADLPLKHAREGSTRERFAKWRRRNPWLPARLVAAGALGLALGAGAVKWQRAAADARTAVVAQAREVRDTLARVRFDLVVPDPATRDRGTDGATAALAAFGLPGDANWRQRAEVRALPDAERAALVQNVGELLALLAQTKDAGTGAEAAWNLNVAARDCFEPGAVPFLDRQASGLASRLGRTFERPAPAAGPAPVAKFLDASEALAAGKYAAAADLFEAVVAARPDHAAAQFALAYCRQQKGEYHAALERYKVAGALAPTDPRPLLNRGQIYSVLKRHERAEAEYTAALKLDPANPTALAQRALARLRSALGPKGGGKPALAAVEDDLLSAEAHGAPQLFVLFVRVQVCEARGTADGAREARAAARAAEPKFEHDFLARGCARMDSDPLGAYADFREAERLNPHSQVALQNQSHLLADRLNDPAGALAVTNRVVELYPEHAPGRAGRAVVLARLGRAEEAHAELARARQLSDDATVLYQGACVRALTGDRDEAIDLLRKAFRAGYTDLTGMDEDPDLKALRELKEYKELRASAATLLK
jgi:serine/threonine protein kinase/Flp pilus assembly protein TadD